MTDNEKELRPSLSWGDALLRIQELEKERDEWKAKYEFKKAELERVLEKACHLAAYVELMKSQIEIERKRAEKKI